MAIEHHAPKGSLVFPREYRHPKKQLSITSFTITSFRSNLQASPQNTASMFSPPLPQRCISYRKAHLCLPQHFRFYAFVPLIRFVFCLLLPLMLFSKSTLCLADSTPAAVRKAPNIVLILADDLGYGDCGCYGQKRLSTPNIDRLAAQGLRWTQFYAGSTVCAPSRCVLMTGKHTGRCLIRGNSKDSLPAEEKVFTEVLAEQGYRCGLFGKWGLGQAGTSGAPLRKGFHEFFGYLDQTHAHNFFPTFLDANEGTFPLANVVPNASPAGAGVATERVDDASELILQGALNFVNEHREVPFFLFFSLNLPHANNEAGNLGTQEFGFGKYASKNWPEAEKGFAHSVEKMDQQIGRLVDRIDELGLGDSTAIFFSSDNGPHHEGGHSDRFFESSGPLRGSKRDLIDGGIRVPTIARWTGNIAPNCTTDQLGCFDDLFPTFVQLATGSQESPKDLFPADLTGVSLVPTLLGKPEIQEQRDSLYWSFYEGAMGQALRTKEWKLVEQPYGSPVRLYNILDDSKEQHELSDKHPDLVRELKAKMSQSYVPGERPWVLRATAKAKDGI